MEGAYEYLNAEVPKIIAIPDDEPWADIKNIKDLTGAIGKRSFGGSLRSKSKYMNQQEPTYKIDTAIRNTAHGLVCRISGSSSHEFATTRASLTALHPSRPLTRHPLITSILGGETRYEGEDDEIGE